MSHRDKKYLLSETTHDNQEAVKEQLPYIQESKMHLSGYDLFATYSLHLVQCFTIKVQLSLRYTIVLMVCLIYALSMPYLSVIYAISIRTWSGNKSKRHKNTNPHPLLLG
jgi:hypothetical protein